MSLLSFTIPLSSPSVVASASSDSLRQNPRPQFFRSPIQVTRFIPSIAVTASALLLLRFGHNPSVVTVPIPLPNQVTVEELEERAIKELSLERKPHTVLSLRYFKLQEGAIVRLFHVQSNGSYSDWPLLKARIRRSSEWLELAKLGLAEVVAKDPERVTEYSLVVDELIDLLRRMESEIAVCEKQNMKELLSFYDRLLARVTKLESEIFYALRYYQECEEEEN